MNTKDPSWPLYDRADDFPPGIVRFLADYPELSWMFLRRHHIGLGRILALVSTFGILVVGALALYVCITDRSPWLGVGVGILAALWALVAKPLTRGHRLALRWSDVAGIVVIPLAVYATLPWIHLGSVRWMRGAESLFDDRVDYAVLIGMGLWTLAMAARLTLMLAESIDHWHGRRALIVTPAADDRDVSWVGSLGERLDTKAHRSLFVRTAMDSGYSRVAVWLGGVLLASMLSDVAGGIDYAHEDIALGAAGIVALIASTAILDAGRPGKSARCSSITVIILVVVSILGAYSVFGDFYVLLTVQPVIRLYSIFIVLSAAATFLSILTNHIARLRLLGDTVE